MSEIPESLYYTEEHEYVKPSRDAGVVIVGITDYAQGELGDIVYVELPAVGETFDRLATFGTIEAVKAVSELYCPVDGEIVDVNGALEGDPGLVNRDPYGDGWMIQIALKDPNALSSLLTVSDYASHIGE